MSDILQRLRECYSVKDGICDFDSLKADPSLRENEMWQDVAVVSDAYDEIERLRGLVDDFIMAVELPGQHCELDQVVARAKAALGDKDET